MRTLNDGGSNDRPLKRELFGTTPSLDLFNIRTLSIWQPIVATTVMNMNPIMAVVLVNVLCIQRLKYHDNDDLVVHIWQLTKVCVINGEDTNDHKFQYFPNSLRGRATNWFARYGMIHLAATWDEVQWAFISQFSEFVVKDKQLQLWDMQNKKIGEKILIWRIIKENFSQIHQISKMKKCPNCHFLMINKFQWVTKHIEFFFGNFHIWYIATCG